jgi:hypothetical protein
MQLKLLGKGLELLPALIHFFQGLSEVPKGADGLDPGEGLRFPSANKLQGDFWCCSHRSGCHMVALTLSPETLKPHSPWPPSACPGALGPSSEGGDGLGAGKWVVTPPSGSYLGLLQKQVS